MTIRHFLLLGGTCLAVLACSPSEMVEVSAPETALVIQPVELTIDQQTSLDTLKSEAREIDATQDPREWQRRWRLVLVEAETLYPSPHPELEVIKQEIAFGDFLLGNIGDALPVLEASIPVYAAGGPEWRDKHVETMGNLSVVLLNMGEIERSRELVFEVMDVRRAQNEIEPYKDLGTVIANAAMAERYAGNYDSALRLNAEAIALHEQFLANHADLKDELGVALSNRLLILHDADLFDDANRTVRETLARIDTLLPPDHPNRAYLLQTSAGFLDAAGRYDTAEELVRRAIALRRAAHGDDAPNTAVPRQLLVSLLLKRGRAEEALPLAELNHGIFQEAQGPGGRETFVSRVNMAAARIELGDDERGLREMRDLVTDMSEVFPEGSAEILEIRETLAENLVKAAGQKQDSSLATEAAELLTDMSRARSSVDGQKEVITARYESLLALAEIRSGRVENGATRLSEIAPKLSQLAIQDALRAERGGRQNSAVRGVLSAGLAAAAEVGDTERFTELYQMRGLTQAGLAARTARARRGSADALVGRQMRDRQKLIEARATARQSYYTAVATEDETNALADEIEVINVRIDAMDETLASAGAALVDEAPTLRDLQPTLEDDEAILLTAETPFGIYAAMVTSTDAIIHSSVQGAEPLGTNIAALRTAISSGTETSTKDIAAQAQTVTQGMFGDEILSALETVTSLHVQSQGRLASVPLSVMRHDGQWWADRFAIKYPLSLSANRSEHASGTADRFIGIGAPNAQDESAVLMSMAPAPSGVAALRSAADQKAIADLPALSFAATELRELADASEAQDRTILTGPRATERRVRSADLSSADILAFATHGVLAGELPDLEESALVLALPDDDAVTRMNDGLLLASEIAMLDLDADWVILSACHSAAGDRDGGDAFSGLASAFMQAGAETLMVSHWPVRDDAARFLTTRTLSASADGMDRAAALKQAVAELRMSNLPGADHPSVWAPMVLVSR